MRKFFVLLAAANILCAVCCADATYPSGVPSYRDEIALDPYWTEYALVDHFITVPSSPNTNGDFVVRLDYNLKGTATTTVCDEVDGGGNCLTEETTGNPLAGQFFHDVNWSRLLFNVAQADETYYLTGTYYSTTNRARWTNDHRDDSEAVIDALLNGIIHTVILENASAIQFTGDASSGPVHVLDFGGMSGLSADDDLLHFSDFVRFSGGAIWYHLGARPPIPNIGDFGAPAAHFSRLFFLEGFFGENDTVQLRESYLLVGDAELERVLMDLAAPPYVIVRADDAEEAIEVQDETLTERWTVYGDGVVEADAINTNFFSGWKGLADATYYYETNAINDNGWSDSLNFGTLATGARPVLETLKFRIYTARAIDFVTEMRLAYKTDLASTTIWFTFDDYGNGTSGWETFAIDLSSLKLAADGHLVCEIFYTNIPIQAGRLSWMSVDWRTERG